MGLTADATNPTGSSRSSFLANLLPALLALLRSPCPHACLRPRTLPAPPHAWGRLG